MKKMDEIAREKVKERRRAYTKEWRKKNNYDKEYYIKNKEKISERRKEWRKNNKIKVKERERKRNEGVRNGIFKVHGKECMVCGLKKTLDFHHTKKAKRKYKNDYSDVKNILVLCPNHHTMIHRGVITEEDLIGEIEDGKR